MVNDKIYYCDTCLNIRTELVEMDKVDAPNQYKCPECGECWKINSGQVRHLVASKIHQYVSLAKQLGMKREDV